MASAAALWMPPAAVAQSAPRTAERPSLTEARSPGQVPPGYRVSAREALAAVARVPAFREARARHPGSRAVVRFDGRRAWVVSLYPRDAGDRYRRELVEAVVDGRTGAVTEDWTGFRAYYQLARGYPGYFGDPVSDAAVWLPLTLLFLVPFVDRRRWRRLLHLDLLVLAAFSVSFAFFTAGEIETSTPLVYPLLAYLLVRMLQIARRAKPGLAAGRAIPVAVPLRWLAIGTLGLVGLRIAMNIGGAVADIGYAGVVGADRIGHGEAVYGNFPADNLHGDTYGPLLYLLYVPFELIAPWSGRWDSLPAAHLAAIAFDLGCLALLYLLGRRLGGRPLAVALSFAWAAYPFTALSLVVSSNDALVPLFVVLALLLAARPAAQGAAAALGAAARLVPAVVAPVLALGGGARRDPRGVVAFVVAFGLVAVAAGALVVDDLGTFWDRTAGFQSARDSPFSIWGLYDLDALQSAAQLAAGVLVLALPFVVRRGDTAGLAAASAAALLAVELALNHWFYTYAAWFLPLVMLALLDDASGRASTATITSGKNQRMYA